MDYIKDMNPNMQKYDVERASNGFFDITISYDGVKHRAVVFFGGNMHQGYADFETRIAAKNWIEEFVAKRQNELAGVIEASMQYDDGVHWIKSKYSEKYKLVDFRKSNGIIQVYHFGWDAGGSLEEYDISSIRKADLVDPDGNAFVYEE
jgi:hypothetical protein